MGGSRDLSEAPSPSLQAYLKISRIPPTGGWIEMGADDVRKLEIRLLPELRSPLVQAIRP
jgi:hypothetical protein